MKLLKIFLRMIKNKKAILALEQIIQLLIAVIAIILIITLFTRITSCGDTRELQAKGTLDMVEKITSELNENEPKQMELSVPANWRIISFDSSHNENEDYKKPMSLFGKNVICICKDNNCNFCIETKLPVKQNETLANIKIDVSYLIFLKLNDKINITKTYEDINKK